MKERLSFELNRPVEPNLTRGLMGVVFATWFLIRGLLQWFPDELAPSMQWVLPLLIFLLVALLYANGSRTYGRFDMRQRRQLAAVALTVYLVDRFIVARVELAPFVVTSAVVLGTGVWLTAPVRRANALGFAVMGVGVWLMDAWATTPTQLGIINVTVGAVFLVTAFVEHRAFHVRLDEPLARRPRRRKQLS